MSDDDIQITYFGYEKPGEKYYDPASAMGTGDRSNPMVAGYSVALSQPERFARFGIVDEDFYRKYGYQKSTGREFEYRGKRYRDDDSTAHWITNRRIDIYSPAGPGTATPTSATPVELGVTASRAALQPQPEQAPNIFDPAWMTSQIRQNSGDDYKDWQDKPLFEAFKGQYPTTFEQLKALAPEYKDPNSPNYYQNDNDLKHALHRKFAPDMAYEDFDKRIDPGKSSQGFWQNFTEQLGPAIAKNWFQGIGQIAQFPGRQEWIRRFNQLLGGDYEAEPPAVTALTAFGKSQEQLSQDIGAETPPTQGTFAGRAGQGVGAFIGGAPNLLASWGPGSFLGPLGGLLWGLYYEGTSADAEAREKNIDPARRFGGDFAAGGFRAMQQMILATRQGRLASMLSWGVLNMAQGRAQAILNGQEKPAFKEETADFTLGAILGAFTAKGMNRKGAGYSDDVVEAVWDSIEQNRKGNKTGAQQAIDRALMLLPDAEKQDVSQRLLKWTNDMAPESGHQLEVLPLEPPPEQKPFPERHPSDYTFFGPNLEPMNLGNLIMDLGRPRRQIGELQIFEEPPEKGGEDIRAEKRLALRRAQERATAQPPRIHVQEERAIPIMQGIPEVPKLVGDLGPKAVQNYLSIAEPYDRFKYYHHLWSQGGEGRGPEPKWTGMLSGFNLGAVQRGIEKIEAPWKGFWGEPRNLAEEFAQAAITEQKARAAVGRQRVIQDMVSKMELVKDFQFAREKGKREAWWEYFPEQLLMQMAENWEAGKSTGYLNGDRLMNIYDIVKRAIAVNDRDNGLFYDIHEHYIPHVLKDYPKLREALNRYIAKNSWGDPSFVHHRVFDDLVMLHNFGLTPDGEIVAMFYRDPNTGEKKPLNVPHGTVPLKLRTYNQEKLTQIRLNASLNAIAKGQTLYTLEDNGYAMSTEQMKEMPESMQARLKAKATEMRSPLRDPLTGQPQLYWVENNAYRMLRSGFGGYEMSWSDPRSIVDQPVYSGPIRVALDALSVLKQRSVPVLLSWSGFHQLHMLSLGEAQSLTNMVKRLVDKTARPEDVWRGLADLTTFGLNSQIKSMGYNQHLLKYYRSYGDERVVLWEDLSPAERQRLYYHQLGGFVPLITHERELQFLPWVTRLWVGKTSVEQMRKVDSALDFGYRMLTMEPYQKWLFGRAIPSLKMMAYDMDTDALLAKNPKLIYPENRVELQTGLARIRREVDAHFGEAFWDAIFWPKLIKEAGKVGMLSLTWKLGAWRTYAGAVHRLVDSKAYQEVYQDFRKVRDMGGSVGDAGREAFGTFLDRNLLFTAILSGIGVTFAGLVSQFIGGGLTDWKDLFYPKIGKLPNGGDNRRRQPLWLDTEVTNIWHLMNEYGPVGGLAMFMLNSATPILPTLYRAAVNRDYRGTQIWDDADDPDSRAWKIGAYILADSMPIAVQQNFLRPNPGETWRDKVFTAIGLPGGAMWITRSDIENEISQSYMKFERKTARTAAQQAAYDAEGDYRKALQLKDYRKASEAENRALQLGVSQKGLTQIQKDVSEGRTFGENKLHQLPTDEQIRILKSMKPDDFRRYFPFAKKDLRENWNTFLRDYQRRHKSTIFANPFAQGAQGFQEGGIVGDNGPVVVGESGPEGVILPSGSQITVGQQGPQLLNLPTGSEVVPESEGKPGESSIDKIWDRPGVSPLSQYPFLWNQRRGFLSPLPISPHGEPGTQMFWRQTFEEGKLPPGPEQPEPLPPIFTIPGARMPTKLATPPQTLDAPSLDPGPTMEQLKQRQPDIVPGYKQVSTDIPSLISEIAKVAGPLRQSDLDALLNLFS